MSDVGKGGGPLTRVGSLEEVYEGGVVDDGRHGVMVRSVFYEQHNQRNQGDEESAHQEPPCHAVQ